MVAIIGVFREGADGHKDQIVGPDIDSAFDTVFAPLDAGRLFAARGNVEVYVCDLDPVAERHAMILKPFHQRQYQRFILVVPGEFQCTQIRHSADVVDETV